MISAQNDDYTPFGVSQTARCTGCGSNDSEFFVFPTTNISRILCIECVRGAVQAVAKEHKRRDLNRPRKA